MRDAAAQRPMQQWPATMRLSRRYRETALTAFQQVEDNLAALVCWSGRPAAASAVASAEESLAAFYQSLSRRGGQLSQVMTAQTTALDNERNEIDIQRRRMDASPVD